MVVKIVTCATFTSNTGIKFIKSTIAAYIFTKIAVTKIPVKIINLINKEVDLIVNNRSRLKKSDYSKKLVGQVKQEIKLSNTFVNKYLFKFIKMNVKN